VEIFDSTFAGRVPILCTDWREISHGQADPRATGPCQISRESVQGVARAGAILPVTRNQKHRLEGNAIPAGYSHAHMLIGVNYYLNSNHTRFLA